MVIVVKYFASISDAIGKTSEQIEWQDKITLAIFGQMFQKILNTLER
jgi:molybdopterin converting factor small subunit